MACSFKTNRVADGSTKDTYGSTEETSIILSSAETPAETRRASNENWTWAQIIAGIGIGFYHINSGTLLGFSSTTLPELMNTSNNETLTLTENEAQGFAAALFLGCLPGSLASGLLLSPIGQKRVMLLGLPIQSLIWVFMSLANRFELLVLCRILQGFIHSILLSASLTYVGEVCQPRVRGKMISIGDLLRQTGFLVVYLLGSTWLGWRKMALICGLTIPVVPFVTMLFLPGSPRWLASKSKLDRSESSLRFFRRGQSRSAVQEEFDHIVEGLGESARKLSMLIIFWSDFLINFTGAGAIQTFAVIIFTAVTEQVNAYLITVLVGCAKLAGALIFFGLSDRYGRRPLFIISLVMSSVFIGFLGIYFIYKNALESYEIFNWILVISILLDFVCFSVSVGVNTALRVELHPTEFRSIGVGMNMFSYHLGNIIASMTLFTSTRAIGYGGIFCIYSIIGIVLALMIWAFVPETRGRTLEEINILRSRK